MLLQFGPGATRFPPSGWRHLYAATSLSPGGIGMVRISSEWQAALALYLEDRTSEAREIAVEAGAGDAGEYLDALGVIEAEWATGRSSQILTVNEWLEVEAVPDELPCSLSELGELARQALNESYRRLRMADRYPVLLTILSRKGLPPMPFADIGYVIAKTKAAKLCVSPNAVHPLDRLTTAIAALGGCHGAAILSDSAAEPWLFGAVMALSNERVPADLRRSFCAGAHTWLKPKDLSGRLLGHTSDIDQMPPFRIARTQALLIGQYLLETIGETGLRRLLSFHAPRPIVHGLRLLLTHDATKAAVKSIYGYAPEKLFEDALASNCK